MRLFFFSAEENGSEVECLYFFRYLLLKAHDGKQGRIQVGKSYHGCSVGFRLYFSGHEIRTGIRMDSS